MTKNDIKLIELPKFETLRSRVVMIEIDNLKKNRRRANNGFSNSNK